MANRPKGPQIGELWEVSDGEDNAMVEILGRAIWVNCVVCHILDCTMDKYIAATCRLFPANQFIRRIQEAEK